MSGKIAMKKKKCVRINLTTSQRYFFNLNKKIFFTETCPLPFQKKICQI